ncbi:MAG: RNA methyltransferase [Geminicoccaceae bacterium]
MTASPPDPAGDAASEPVVILVRPQMGENVGAAARAMLNFGLTRLRLVAPQCGWPNAKTVAASSGAFSVLDGIELFADTDLAIADLQHVFATTARPRGMTKPVITSERLGHEARSFATAGRRVGLLFGPERFGLTNDEIALADAIVTIPLNPDFSSLNLGQAVLLTAYEWHRAGTGDGDRATDPDAVSPASKADVRRLVDRLVVALDERGFFRSPDRRLARIRELELLLERRRLSDPEVHLLHGVIKTLAGGER